MAAITITDLPAHQALDRPRMASISGKGAGWVFGWIRPFIDRPAGGSFGPILNLHQTNNFFSAEQINVQVEAIAIENSAANSTINVNARQQSLNFKV